MTSQPIPKIERSWLCEKCGREFPDHDKYKQHKVDHQLGKVSEGIDPVLGESKKEIEELTKKAVGEAEEEKILKIDQLSPRVVPQEARKDEVGYLPTSKPETRKRPIVLKYKFEGQCDSCDAEVETIEVRLEDKSYCIAYCPGERKQILQQDVIPIVKQLKGGEDEYEKEINKMSRLRSKTRTDS